MPKLGESPQDSYNAEYFCKVVGFFVIENTLLHTTQGLVTHTSIDELWNLFLSCLGYYLVRNILITDMLFRYQLLYLYLLVIQIIYLTSLLIIYLTSLLITPNYL